MRYFIKLGKKLFPICRSITGQGTLKTLKIIKNEIPNLKIKSVKSGSKVFDWKVPDEWNVKDAYVLDKKNKKIINFKKNNLHLVGYSSPVQTTLKKKQFLEKLFFIEDCPKAIPYITSYYKRQWGLSVSKNQFQSFKKKYSEKDEFKVFIKSKFNKRGCLNYGELFIPGKKKDEILISTYICHPSMANNELSGPLLSIALAKYYFKKNLNKSLRFIFIPETIGSICFIKKNFKNLKKILCGINVTCVGDNKKYSYLETKYGDTILDQISLSVYKDLKINFKKYSFLERGSDERQFSSPGINIPMVSLMRSKYGTYPEYHTSLDNFKLVTAQGLKKSFKIHVNLINKLDKENKKQFFFGKMREKKIIKNNPINLIKCEPQMGKRGMYHLISKRGIKSEVKNLMNFLQYADGSNSLHTISKIIKVSMSDTRKIYYMLKKQKIVR